MRCPAHAVLAALCALLSWGHVQPASAGQGLTFRAPAGCPDQLAAHARLTELGVETADALHVQIGAAPRGGLRASITLDGVPQRELESDDCEALTEAVLLVVAMSFAEPAAVSTPQPRAHVTLGAGGFARADLAVLPDPTLGVGASLVLMREALRIELEGVYDLPRATERGGHGGAELGLWSGTLRGCYALLADWQARSPLSLGPCLAVELGVMKGRAFETEASRTRRALWSALWLGVTTSVYTGWPVRPWLNLELGLPVRRPSFDVADHGSVYQAGRLAGRGTIGLLVQFE